MTNVQQWVDQKYPTEEEKAQVWELYLTEPNLTGELDPNEFPGLARIVVSDKIDETKLIIKNRAKQVITILTNPTKFLKQKYPTKEERRNETRLEIDNSDYCLEGSLDLSDFINLEELDCLGNQLTSLNVENCSHLVKINCSGNHLTFLNVGNCSRLVKIDCANNLLTNINLPTNPTKLKMLDLTTNDFPAQDLSFLTPYNNLEELRIANNNFTGSLNFISNMKKLKWIFIDNTDLNEVDSDKLPRSLEKIYYRVKKNLLVS